MYQIKTMDAIREQLAAGNKLSRLRRRIVIDLQSGTKEEIVEAEVQRLIVPDMDKPLPYAEEADQWLHDYLADYTAIVLIGRGGAVARLPYSQKDTLLPRLLQALNS